MNDSLRTNVFVRFQPETIACACIYLAARALQVSIYTYFILNICGAEFLTFPSPLQFVDLHKMLLGL